MHLYERFCRETVAENGRLTQFQLDYPENFNFGYDVVDAMADLAPQQRALVWCNGEGQEEVFTFADLRCKSNQAAWVLHRAGIGRGDHVMVALKRHYEYWFVAVALHKLGAVLIPVTHMLTEQDILYRLNCSPVRAILCTPQNQVPDRMAGAVAQAGLDCRLFTVQEDVPGFVNLTRAMAAEAETLERLPTRAADPMILYFTSGTTGMPKMVQHNFSYPLGHIVTAKYWQQVQENKLHMSVTDSGWAKFGWGKIYGQWIAGATIFAYDMDKFVPTKLLQKIQDYRLTTFCAPPTMYRFMLQEDVAAYDLSSVENFATAGEPLNAEVTIQWERLTGKKIREGFGQTEGPVLLATFPWIEPRPGSMGKPSPLLNVKLLDDDGREVDDGEEGAICVTGLKEAYPPGLFVGYYGNPERTEEAVGGEYYNLHDMAWRDSDGYCYFVGRNDDVIKCSGYRIGPFEVESALVEHPAVVECAVTAAPDPIRGKVVKATIVLAKGYEGTDALTRELQDHVKKTTAPYKYPRIIEYVDELPKTIGGKIKRKLIRQTDGIQE